MLDISNWKYKIFLSQGFNNYQLASLSVKRNFDLLKKI